MDFSDSNMDSSQRHYAKCVCGHLDKGPPVNVQVLTLGAYECDLTWKKDFADVIKLRTFILGG